MIYIKIGTKSGNRIIESNVVAQYVNHNINKTDLDKGTIRYFQILILSLRRN